jgi:hypothetical protein
MADTGLRVVYQFLLASLKIADLMHAKAASSSRPDTGKDYIHKKANGIPLPPRFSEPEFGVAASCAA